MISDRVRKACLANDVPSAIVYRRRKAAGYAVRIPGSAGDKRHADSLWLGSYSIDTPLNYIADDLRAMEG